MMMTSYTDFLATRGYRRITVERTDKAPGDLVLTGHGIEYVPPKTSVVPMRKRAGR